MRRYKRAVRGVIPTVRAWLEYPAVDDGGRAAAATGSEREPEPERGSTEIPEDVIFFVSAGFDAMDDDGFGTENLDAAWYTHTHTHTHTHTQTIHQPVHAPNLWSLISYPVSVFCLWHSSYIHCI